MANYARYIQSDEVIDYTPTADVAAGQVVVQGDLIGVAKRPIDANALGALAVEGVFDGRSPVRFDERRRLLATELVDFGLGVPGDSCEGWCR